MEPVAGFMGELWQRVHLFNVEWFWQRMEPPMAGRCSGSDWRSSLVAVSAASDDPQRQYDEANMEGMTMQEREEASHVENGKRKIGKSLPELETGAAVYGGLGLDRRTELGGIIRGICLPCSG